MGPELLGRDEFVAWLSGKLEQAGHGTRYDAAGFRLLLAGGALRLHRLFESFSEQDEEGRAVLLRQVLENLSSPTVPGWNESRAHVIPRLYSRTVIEETRLHGAELPHVLLTDNVALTLALEHRGITGADLESWGVSFEEALEVALANLRAASSAPPRLLAPGLFAGNWNDANDSARVLMLLELNLPLKGDPVVFMPTREALFITGSEDTEGLGHALERLGQHGHAVTVVPFRHADGAWTRFEVEVDHPHSARLRKLAFDDRYQEYAEQKGLLDSLFRVQGRQVEVASCSGYRLKDGSVMTCSWVNGVETLLPETDRVMLVDNKLPEEDRVVSEPTWAELLERLGRRMTLTEHWPPRWRVCTWRA